MIKIAELKERKRQELMHSSINKLLKNDKKLLEYVKIC
jgi:hypothetical protein